MSPLLSRLRRFFSELRRRNVYKVAVAYVVAGWIVIQAASVILPRLQLPEWTVTFVIVLVGLGFPLVLVFAWAFELTPKGVRRTTAMDGRSDGTSSRRGPDLRGVTGSIDESEEEPPPERRLVAVLPFEALGAEEPGPFSEGMHDALLTRLSKISGLQVVSRTSVQQYRGTEKTTRQIADELGARWILEGGVQEMGDQIQVNAQLIDPRTETHAWAESYRQGLTAENLFAIQSEITKQIAHALEARLTSEEKERIERQPTENLDAYRLYAQGRGHLDERTEDGIQRAFDRFQQAVELDPEYALAWVGLADALSLFEFYGFTAPDEAPDPMTAARQAVELNPELGEAWASLGILHSIRHEGPSALQELTRAVELAPNYAEAHVWLGWLHVCLGHPEQGLMFTQQSVDLNPLAPAFRVYLAEACLANGDADRALREARRARKVQPEYGLTHFMEGLVLYHQGRLDEATGALEQALSLVPPHGTPTHAEVRAALAAACLADGDADSARELLTQIDTTQEPFSAGLIHAALGDAGTAFDAFERVGDWGSFETEHLRYFFPAVLDPLRAKPRYDELIRAVNRSWDLDPDGSLPDQAGSLEERSPRP